MCAYVPNTHTHTQHAHTQVDFYIGGFAPPCKLDCCDSVSMHVCFCRTCTCPFSKPQVAVALCTRRATWVQVAVALCMTRATWVFFLQPQQRTDGRLLPLLLQGRICIFPRIFVCIFQYSNIHMLAHDTGLFYRSCFVLECFLYLFVATCMYTRTTWHIKRDIQTYNTCCPGHVLFMGTLKRVPDHGIPLHLEVRA
jgi:hypothetical protein